MTIHDAYGALYTGSLCVLMALVIFCFVRALKGPSIADRVVAINMIGTQIICMIAVFGLLIGEGYLTDVAIIYAMISFLSVVVLCKVYMGVFLERRAKEQAGGQEHA